MKIGILAAELTPGSGWATYSLSLLRALRDLGAELVIATPRNSPPSPEWQQQPILPTVTPPDRGTLPRLLAAYPALRRRFAACDVIHTLVEPYAPLAVALAGARPAFITGHGSYVHLPRVRRWPVGALYARAFRRSRMICVSAHTAQIAQQITPGLRTQVIPNGVDAVRFAELPPAPEAKGGPLVLASGGVKARKGTLALVQACAVVRQQIPDLRCVVLGGLDAEPAYTAQVRAAINALSLQDCVTLAGYVDDLTLRGWYGAADLFVLPSVQAGWKFEGFGLVYLEAGAAGLPVIGATGSGASDAILHEQTGLLVDHTRLSEALPQAMLRLLQNSDDARHWGRGGRAHAQAQTWTRAAQSLLAAYQAAL